MPPANSEPATRPSRPPQSASSSVRALLFGAILLAGAPGVFFAAMQANHSYDTATRNDAVVRSDDAVRAAVRFDDALQAARDRATAFTIGATVRDPTSNCSSVLADIVKAQSVYAFMGRVDSRGRINCASDPGALGAALDGLDWFKSIKAGAKTATSGISASALSVEPSIVVSQGIRKNGKFDGASVVAIPRSWFEQTLQRDLGVESGGVAVFDHSGSLVVAGARDARLSDVVAVAAEAMRAPNRRATARGLIAEMAPTRTGEFPVVSVTPRDRQVEITFRAALIVLAPILVSALSIVAVWLAMNRWVLRWFQRLRDAAQSFARGAYRPAEMLGAPTEIAALATAFDAAVSQSNAREHDLAGALASNVALTRELHHRVKNNLQVLSSLVSRQQRRSDDPLVRATLSEALARMAPVVLAYRYINTPEERTAIDIHAYFSELARQLHSALNGDQRGVHVHVKIDSMLMTIDDATNVGLIIAEALIIGYANTAAKSAASATLSCIRRADGGCDIAVEVKGDEPRGARPLDRELIQELTRQVRGAVVFEGAGAITLTLPPPAEGLH